MFNIGTVIPAKLSLTWDAIIGVITILGTFWGIYKIIGSKLSKKQYYEEIKQIRDEFKELEKKMKGELDCIEQNNTVSHTRLSQETERYYEILNSQFNKITDSINTKLDMLLEHALNKKK
jgi:hypothetical protein